MYIILLIKHFLVEFLLVMIFFFGLNKPPMVKLKSYTHFLIISQRIGIQLYNYFQVMKYNNANRAESFTY